MCSLWRVGSGVESGRAHNPKVAGSNPAPATSNDEGLADVAAANPFALPRQHPGIGPSAWLQQVRHAGALAARRHVRPADDLPLAGLVGEPVADLKLHREDAACGRRRWLGLLLGSWPSRPWWTCRTSPSEHPR